MSYGTSSTPSRRSTPSTRTCSGTCRMSNCLSSSGPKRDDESVTTTTGMLPRILLLHTRFSERFEHQLGDRLVCLEVPVDAVRVAPPGHHLLFDRRLEVDKRYVMLPGPCGDRPDGALAA